MVLSIAAFCWYFFDNEILLYGDAVAHINIARRVFDSRNPGPLQLGTVWLPFPHILMIPFVIGQQMWTSGWGGSVPSMIAYVLGVIGLFRLVRGRASRTTAWVAAGVFACNPNLLYMQSTAMTESIFLATFIWSAVYLDEFLRRLYPDMAGRAALLPAAKALERCALILAAAILTRYDGWVLAGIVGVIVTVAIWKTRFSERRGLYRSYALFLALCALVPILWLAQNYALSARPLDFLNGPYSAKAIEQRTAKAGDVPHPGTGNLKTSSVFFLKASKLNVADGNWQPLMFALALTGTLVAVLAASRFGVLLLLWFPLPFYAYAVAYGSIPIFMPVWWPHSYYNVRYGLELLPVFAVFVAMNFEWFRDMPPRRLRQGFAAALIIITAGAYISVVQASPICLREARVNSTGRIALEKKLAEVLQKLPDDSTILMQTGEYVGALQRAGVRLRRVVWEGAHPEWDQALANPSGYTDYVVAVEGDQVWYATRLFPEGLRPIAQFDTLGKQQVIVYQTSK